jgi:uncharacterized phage-associated protein
MITAVDLARYVVAKTNKIDHGVNLLKLQQILYFIQAEFLTVFDRPCFCDDIEARKYGARIQSVYIDFLGHGGLRIWYDESRHPKWLDLRVTPDEQYHIDRVICELLPYSGGGLARIVISQDPWKKTYKEGQRRIIPNHLIKSYFQDEVY